MCLANHEAVRKYVNHKAMGIKLSSLAPQLTLCPFRNVYFDLPDIRSGKDFEGRRQRAVLQAHGKHVAFASVQLFYQQAGVCSRDSGF